MAEKALVSLIDHSDEVKTLKDVQVPDKFFTRMLLGVNVLDEIFGGQDWPGILPGSSILLTGMPGAGKSTAALQFADLLQRNAGRNILYNLGEENINMVAMRARRIGLSADFGVSGIEDVDVLIQVCRDLGVEVLFQDSLQSLRTKEDLPRAKMLKAVTKKLHKYAKDDDVAIFIIGHITKGGDFAGPMEIKHDVDIHAHIKLNPDTMAREFQLTKNRFGPSGIPYECNISEKGLDFAAIALVEKKEEGKEEKKGGKASERREATKKVIKDALLTGMAVSPKSYMQLKDPFSGKVGIDCSGGFFGALLEKAVFELKAEGHIVGEVKIDNRTHYRVEI